MQSSDIITLINHIERDFPVDEWTIAGLHIWPLVRITLYYNIFCASIATPTNRSCKGGFTFQLPHNISKALRIITGFAKHKYAYLSDLKNNSRPATTADVVLLSSGVNRLSVGSTWYDKYCDPLVDCCRDLHIRPFVMEMGYEYHTPRYSPSMYIQPVLDWVAIKKLFSVKQDEHYQESLVGFYDCIEILKRTLMGEMPDIQIPDLSEIKRQVILIHAYSDFFKSRLRRIDPVLGFTVCYSSLMAMAFILACKELGIMSVELQHGLQDDLHPAYGRWKRVPVSGYELLPSIFWCWGESEAMVISKWNSSVSQWHKSIVGGSPWVTLWKTGDSDFVSRYDQHVITLKNSHARSMHILLTLQTGLSGVNNIDNIVQSIRTTQHSWRWWIRVHPTTTRKDRDRIKTLLNDNGVWDMEVDNASTLPLYSLLRNVDVHITFSSATILEAISFGVPSVVTSEYGSEFFRDGIISGWVLEAYTPEQIVTAIESQYSKRSVLRQTNKGQSIADTNPLPTLYSLYIESRSSRVQQGKH